MANSHGSKADFIGNGYDLSQFLNTASFAATRDAAETTTFGKTSKTYIPGLRDTTMNADGLFDGATGAVDEMFWACMGAQGNSGIFSYIPEGYETLNNIVYTIDAIDTSYQVTSGVGAVNIISAQFNTGAEGNFTKGRIAHVNQAEGAPGNGTSYDNTLTSTANGGALVVHCIAGASLVLFAQDSADNVTFADLAGSLTMGSSRGSQRLVIPGTIRRYTRVRWTGTGTFVAVFERN